MRSLWTRSNIITTRNSHCYAFDGPLPAPHPEQHDGGSEAKFLLTFECTMSQWTGQSREFMQTLHRA
jgi:hypothetical protein